MVLLGGGGQGRIRFLLGWRGFRRVVQVQQVFQEGVILYFRCRKPQKEVFPREQKTSQDAEILPVFVQSRRIPAVGVVMAVQKIHREQLVQLSASHDFCLVRG